MDSRLIAREENTFSNALGKDVVVQEKQTLLFISTKQFAGAIA